MSRLLKVSVLVLGLALTLALVSCGAAGTAKNGDGRTGTSQTTQNAYLRFGDTATYDRLSRWSVTVGAASDYATGVVPGPMFSVRVSYDNNSTETVPCDRSDWEVEDANGERRHPVASEPTVTVDWWGVLPETVPPYGRVDNAVTFSGSVDDVEKIVYTPPKSLGDADESVWVVK